MRCLVLLVAWLLVSCSGKDGKDGAQGELGEPGEPGQPGERGEPGPAGVSCWDLDTDGECDTGSEDINADGSCDVFDCRADAAGSGTGGATGTGGANGTGGAGATGTDTGGSGATTTGGSAGSPGAATCAPSDMSSWTPPAYKPARAAEAVCTEAVLTEFFSSECEWGGCPEFQPGGQHEVCGACLTGSSVDDAEWGPFVIVLCRQAAPHRRSTWAAVWSCPDKPAVGLNIKLGCSAGIRPAWMIASRRPSTTSASPRRTPCARTTRRPLVASRLPLPPAARSSTQPQSSAAASLGPA